MSILLAHKHRTNRINIAMRNYINLVEDVKSDVSGYKQAYEIKRKLITYLMNPTSENYGFKILRFPNKEIFLTLRGFDIGLEGDEANLWFRFGEVLNYTPSGNISKFKMSKEFVITIYCLDQIPDTIDHISQAVKTIIHNQVINVVILHELIHYLDNKRHEFIGKAKGNNEDDRSNTSDAEYYNRPHELNAYYNNLAEPLLHTLLVSETNIEAAKRLAKGLHIDKDFLKTFKMLFSSGHAGNYITKKFYDNLTPQLKKNIVRRLYLLHQELVEKLEL